MPKYCYAFANGKAEGKGKGKELLGGKGAGLAEMTDLGIPVPPGFTISTEVCKVYYDNDRTYPESLDGEIDEHIVHLEQAMGAKFGDHDNPLLVSVRSGAAVSMPGMMDTVLNLGLNPAAVDGLIKKTDNPRFGWDAYRRFIQMFGNVVMGINGEKFEHELDAVKQSAGVAEDTDLSAEHLQDVVKRFENVYEQHTGKPFPTEPREQLRLSIDAVFGSWNNDRAIKYRQLNKIAGLIGTAVNVQAMVFGNMGNTSATGVCFTRDPATGENVFYGEYLINAQGEDVVAGIRTPHPIAKLGEEMPDAYAELVETKNRLERHYADVQDMEFTIQEDKLYFLQTRTGKRTAPAAVKIAVDMVEEGMITQEIALQRVEAGQLDQLLHPTFDPKADKVVLATGLPASPGAAKGKVVFTADDAEAWVARGEQVILVRSETSPEDIGGMHAARGILTATGGMTSHAAVVARGMGTCCVAGCGAVVIDNASKQFSVNSTTVKEGDIISLDGSTGEVMLGDVPTVDPKLGDEYHKLMGWADGVRTMKIRTNADTPHDAQVARDFGAEGIGLCRTEHMFFEGDRIVAVREMILADDEAGRRAALAKLLPMQRDDFVGIFTTMNGLPVTIRLLDPPLHEFLPHEEDSQQEMADTLGVSIDVVRRKVKLLHEFNPMLGHRGCRLGITYPEIYEMQVQAILEAAVAVTAKDVNCLPEIMIPLIGTIQELTFTKERALAVAERVLAEAATTLEFLIGTMIEIPRAALTADEIAAEAQFFSFGTNDLTQMAFGYSRDDSGGFLTEYVQKGILPDDPFQTIDETGVGQLMRIAVEKGRGARPNLKIGICGEHGGDPASIDLCHRLGMNYVSCSPYRVPIARLAAAHAALKHG